MENQENQESFYAREEARVFDGVFKVDPAIIEGKDCKACGTAVKFGVNLAASNFSMD